MPFPGETGRPSLPQVDIPERFGLRLVEPQSHIIFALEEDLFTAASSLGVEAPRVIWPQGVLESPLTGEQKTKLNNLLSPEYARYFVALQDRLRSVEIYESGERMVDLPGSFRKVGVEASFSQMPITQYAKGGWAGESRVFWVREGVAEKLVSAAAVLNQIGLKPHVEDTFRPVGVQEGLFQRVAFAMQNLHPDWTPEMIQAETRSKVANAPWIAGHKAGAAVDITLTTLKGSPLDVGNSYIEPGVAVAFDFPFLTTEQWANRQLFAGVFGMVGLYIYPGENWHMSYGDVAAGVKVEDPSKYIAKYGPIQSFEPNGDVEPYDPKDYYKEFEYELK